jgi:formyl-CoA transferase
MLADEHLRSRGAFVEIDHPVTGPQTYFANTGFRIEGMEPLDSRRTPLLGEHTDEVLRRWLRIGDDEIASLRASGAVGY